MATRIPIDQIVDNPFQPRTHFDKDALRSLADEIKAEGFWSTSLQGRRTKTGKIELVFGHRRLRALKLLKVDAVAVDLVNLTDSQMALRSLEENLQREGLGDIEKADGIKQAVEIERAALKAAGKNESHAIVHVANRLGLGVSWVSALCQISSTIVEKNRGFVEQEYLSAKTAFLAKQWGGDAYVKTLAKQGKRFKEENEGTKPSENLVAAMKKVVQLAPESIQEKLKEAIFKGDVTTPKEAEQKGRRMAAERTKRNKLPPADLRDVIIGWTHTLKDWNEQLKDVTPYMDYVDEVPEIAKPFRVALEKFIETAKKLL